MMTVLPAVKTLALLFGGYIFIFCGIAFTNKRFFTDMFTGVYDNTSFFMRVVLFSIVFAIPGNYLISKSFQVSSASVAGPLLILTVVVMTVINAMVLDKVTLTYPIIASIAAAMFFCCLTAWLLEGQRIAG